MIAVWDVAVKAPMTPFEHCSDKEQHLAGPPHDCDILLLFVKESYFIFSGLDAGCSPIVQVLVILQQFSTAVCKQK